jgi:hypothetical protein
MNVEMLEAEHGPPGPLFVRDPARIFTGQDLAPLLERVCRSHHWKAPKGADPGHVDEPLTDAMIAEHLAGGLACGVCPIIPGESTTRVALLDFDSHHGKTPWPEMVKAAQVIDKELLERGYGVTPFRSRNGAGIHLFLLFKEPQDARSVREMLTDVLATHGYTNGTGGVAAKEVEVFPKQNKVLLGKCGSMFVLPFSGQSRVLEAVWYEVLEAVHMDENEWCIANTSVPYFAPPPPKQRTQCANVGGSHDFVESDIKEMLDSIKPGNREHWTNICWAMRRTWHAANVFTDAEKYLQVLDAYSSRPNAGDYQGIDDVRYTWEQADEREDGPNVSFLYNEAKNGGWQPTHAQNERLHAADTHLREEAGITAPRTAAEKAAAADPYTTLVDRTDTGNANLLNKLLISS